MTDAKRDRFSAADSVLGYLYQCRVALVTALQRIRAAEEFTVALEILDDVVFEKEGQSTELLQTKHHRSRSANPTDASPDLWKSLRIWCKGLAGGSFPAGTSFHLITSRAGDDSAAHRLSVTQRDVPTARARLHATAQTSTNPDNKGAYEAFLALTEDQQGALLDSGFVIDSSPAIGELDDRLRAGVRWAAEKQHLESFVSRLEGWRFRRAIQQMRAPIGSNIILSQEIEAQMDDLREQFKRDALPIDEDILAATVLRKWRLVTQHYSDRAVRAPVRKIDDLRRAPGCRHRESVLRASMEQFERRLGVHRPGSAAARSLAPRGPLRQ